MGDFTNWECRTGSVSGNGGLNTVTWYGLGEVSDRHQLIAPNNTAVDEYGGFPQHCPNTNSYSVRLGNDNNGHEAEGIFYTFDIPANNTKFSILYHYAVVLQDPGHMPHEQPRFRARVMDVATETEIDCVSFDFSSSGSLPGFQQSNIGNAVYKDWTPVSVDLSSFAGKTIRLEFITSDCVFQQHFGYAYISLGSSCNGSITGNYYCEGDTAISLTAPYGYSGYQWYSNNSFTQLISSTQSMELNVANTPIGSVFPVIVYPFPGYGCLDTLYASIGTATKPLSKAGPDLISCSKKQVQIGAGPNNDYSYAWTPVQLLSDPYISNPATLPTIINPTEFIVKTTDLATGCFSFDTTLVTPIVVDTSSSIAGESIYCRGEPLQATLTANNSATEIQWFNGNTLINGANNFSYQPLSAGTYWAQIKQFGCVDSTLQYNIKYAPFPQADFSVNKEIQCLNYPVTFTNKSSIDGNEPMQYLWEFSDGISLQTIHAEKAFSTIGSFMATLIVTSGADCIDSVRKTVSIVTNCTPVLPTAFTPNSDGRNDRLTPFLIGAKGLKRFTIYNRYGNIVFSTSKEGEGWDGRYKGTFLPTAVFVWVIEYTGNDDQVILEKGTVTLIR